MALAYDTSSQTTVNGGTSASWSHTCTGSNRLLVVMVNLNPGTLRDCSAVTYNGVSMTQITGSPVQYDPGDYNMETSLWVLINPASGSNTVAVTFAGGGVGAICAAVSYTGARQSSQPEAQSVNANVTTVTAGSWVVAGCSAPGSDPTAGTWNLRQSGPNAGAGSRYGGVGDSGKVTPAGSTAIGLGNYAAYLMAAIAPDVADVARPNYLPLMGVS